jgi:hypothetical protein
MRHGRRDAEHAGDDQTGDDEDENLETEPTGAEMHRAKPT